MAATFWWWLTMVCLVWYCSITVYVGIRGARDIQGMLKRLKANHLTDDTRDAASRE